MEERITHHLVMPSIGPTTWMAVWAHEWSPDLDRERRDHPVPVLQCTLFHTSSKSSPKMMQAYISGSTCVNSASPFSCSSGLACLFLQALTFSSGLIPAVFAIFSVPLPDWSQVSWVWMLQVLHGVVFFRVVAESSKYSSRDREGAWLQDVDHLLIQMRVLADTSSSNDMFEVLRTPWSSPWRSTATWSLSRTGSWVTPSQWPPTRR